RSRDRPLPPGQGGGVQSRVHATGPDLPTASSKGCLPEGEGCAAEETTQPRSTRAVLLPEHRRGQLEAGGRRGPPPERQEPPRKDAERVEKAAPAPPQGAATPPVCFSPPC